MSAVIIPIAAARLRRVADLRAAVAVALDAWRETRPGTAARAFWHAELIDAERRLSIAEGMPRAVT